MNALPDTLFHAPQALAEALRLLASSAGGAAARPLAGGSDLIVQMRTGRLQPGAIVDLKRIDGLIGIHRQADGGWLIGAATPCALITRHAGLQADWPGVVEAAGLIGSPQVQGRASLGGNLCNASPAADSVPALMAAGATAVVGTYQASGAATAASLDAATATASNTASGAANDARSGSVQQRELPIHELLHSPGRTTLAAGELLLAIRLPAPAPGMGDAYLRLIPRSEMDIAVVGCGVALQLDGSGRISRARVALGAVAPTARLVPAAADALVGQRLVGQGLVGQGLDADTLQALAAAARAACQPIDDKRGTAAYRTRVAGVLACRAAQLAAQRAQAALGRAQEMHP